MPWLYYASTADKVINNTERIKFEVSFDPNDKVNVNDLQFYIAKYDIFGNFLGIKQLTSELNLCSKTYEDGIDYRSFGKTIINRCEINLCEYQTKNHTMYFYEMYMLDPKQNELIDIPIMIDNIPNPKASGTIGNMNNSTNPIDWILVRRFFLIDNLSAIQGTNSFINGDVNASAIRFPRLIKLIVLLQEADGSKIMVPYLEIFYKTKSDAFIQQTPQTLVIFVSEYKMSIKSFKNAALAILITLIVLIIVVVCVKMYIWYRLNPPSLSPVIKIIFI
jgi:meckelin